jgi:ABC-2 type transport system ATP-binding protein
MTDWADKRIGKFSKGMKQRVAIAQAILHEPSVIILDEPTSGLDPRGMVEVREILTELKRADYTVFMSSHLLNEVQEVCTDVVLIDHGKLLRSGSVASLVGQASVRRIEVAVLQKVSRELLNKVSKLDGVTELRAAGENQFMFSLKGGVEAQSKALMDLQSIGLNVVSYRESGLALESLYMSLIKDSR